MGRREGNNVTIICSALLAVYCWLLEYDLLGDVILSPWLNVPCDSFLFLLGGIGWGMGN